MSDQRRKPVAGLPEWQSRSGRQQIAPDRWGRDHWGLLAFVETCEVDCHGLIDWDRVTLSRTNWPMLWAARSPWTLGVAEDAADAFGVRLRDVANQPATLFGHCAADALMDLVESGLVTIEMPQTDEDGQYYLKPDGRRLEGAEHPRPGFISGVVEWQLMPWGRFRLTERGRTLANELRVHKAAGGNFATFQPALESSAMLYRPCRAEGCIGR
ncbi:hypothetical protein PV726_32520 [Streptomyces europaeiscabiei]|uniref:hypothetical protein n=1 Tax=Streptomyces europaeiscabiei TaxID=146819 RepID=UPI0029A21139|nr:hypothetical protein [Streptomyces europaeiscabiei]MDX3694983.1 hypothetical protein [Streptomyces europaeiscabiei]